MKLNKLNVNSKTVMSSLPIRLAGSNSRAVLILHGYNGITDDVRYLSVFLHSQGFTVFAPRNCGCGTNHHDFLAVTANDWIRHAFDCYLDLKAEYEDITIVGLSMGGLLATILAAQFQPERLILAAPAFFINPPILPLTRFARFFKTKIERKNTQIEHPTEDEHYLYNEYWRYHYLPMLYQFYKVQQKARRVLPKVQSHCLTFVSHSDKTVPIKTAEYLHKRMCRSVYRCEILTGSDHIITNGVDREFVARRCFDFIINEFKS